MTGHAKPLAGTLRERITIARRADGAGDWAVLALRRAAVRADGGGETVVGEATSAAPRFLMTVRAGVDAQPGDRIGWAGRTLRVRGVIADPTIPDRIVLKVEELR